MNVAIVALPREQAILRRALLACPEHRVAWSVASGEQAIERCAGDAPDLILMGLSLEGAIDGVETTRRIMAATPCAILAVADGVRSDGRRLFEAMGRGALDAVDLTDPALLVSKIAASARLVADRSASGRVTRSTRHAASAPAGHPLIAIGASAGGPAALATVLAGLPRDLPAAIVIVQHVDEQMASGLADWLGQRSALPLRVAVEGDHPVTGTILLAGTNDHLILKSATRLGYTADPGDYVYRPSVDVFFNSVSRLWRGEAVGVLLTGMGRDGALGLKALRSQGRYTIAQDQASSAVFGMPKAAAALGAAVDVLPVDRIASRLVDALAHTRL